MSSVAFELDITPHKLRSKEFGMYVWYPIVGYCCYCVKLFRKYFTSGTYFLRMFVFILPLPNVPRGPSKVALYSFLFGFFFLHDENSDYFPEDILPIAILKEVANVK